MFAHLSDYAVYKITNTRKRYGAPFPWGICLRPTSTGQLKTIESGEAGLKVIAFHSEKSRACWLTAMRLAKVIKHSILSQCCFSFLFFLFFPFFFWLFPSWKNSCELSSLRESYIFRRNHNIPSIISILVRNSRLMFDRF